MLQKMPVFALLIFFTGCTHTQLQRTTVKQISTWSELQSQQTMNNLAMFCVNPSALPYYSVTGAGVTQLTDSTNAATAFVFPPFDGASAQTGINGGVGRQLSEQWSLAPTTDPGRLEIIRVLLQFTVTGAISTDDRRKVNDFFGDDEWERWDKLQTCWFHVGSKKDMPKCVCHAANYCDTYVWVTAEGCEGLTQLTLALLDVVTADPDPSPAVEHYRFQQISGNERKDVFHVERYTTKEHMTDDDLPGVALSKAAALIDEISTTQDPLRKQAATNQATEILNNLLPFVVSDKHQESLQSLIKSLQDGKSKDLPKDTASTFRNFEIKQQNPPRRMGRLNYYSPSGLQFVPKR